MNFITAMAFGLAILIGVSAAQCTSDHAAKLEAERNQRVISRGCIVVGYYGRSGEYATYNCNGVIVKEQDI